MTRSALLISTIFLGLVPGRLSGELKPIQPLDLFEFEFVLDPQISPNGEEIVYVRRYSDILTDRRYSNLWLVGHDGSNHRPLTTGLHHDGFPRWSPDGSKLLYVSDREGKPQIYVKWMETGEVAKATNLIHAPQVPVWSPDGKWIAYRSFVPEAPQVLGKHPPRPTGAIWADPAVVVDRYMFRMDGAGYLDPGYSHLFVVPAEGGTPRQISSGDFHHGAPFPYAGQPVWTQDGESLLLSTNRHSDYEFNPLNTEIYEFSLTDGSLRQLTERSGSDDQPSVSPDGSLIAYTGFDDRDLSYHIRRLYVMNRDGSGVKALSKNLDRSVNSPRWTADGKSILGMSSDHGSTQIVQFSLDGSMEVLTSHVGTGGWAFSYGASFSLSNTGRLAFPYTDSKIPGDLAVINLKQPNTTLLTTLNQELLSQRQLGEVEEFWFNSSKDGRKIQGWIVKPPGFDPSKKYPLILEIHGGPFASFGKPFALDLQLYAAQGYVVLYVNPRGSTSYGEEFANLIHRAFPGDDFYDLNSGVDAMVSEDYIDSENLFVTGGSAGGILTCWMIGKTDRFRAAASLYTVVNWYPFVLTIDDPLLLKYQFPGFPWDHPEHYAERSPISLVGKVKTPTLLLTGEKDYRTPLWEAEQYYRALKLLDIDTVLVRVPGEPHGTAVRPSHLMERLLMVTGWFDRYRER